MDRSGLTTKQRQALQCVEGARAAGMTLSGYARPRQLAVRPIYDALVSRRKKGLMRSLAPSSTKSPFVAVRVLPTSTMGPTSTAGLRVVCRIAQGGCCALTVAASIGSICMARPWTDVNATFAASKEPIGIFERLSFLNWHSE